MKPGPELDVLIAEKIMGCQLKVRTGFQPYGLHCGCKNQEHEYFIMHSDAIEEAPMGIKPYSTYIAAAWEIIDKLKHLHPNFYFDTVGNLWHVGFKFNKPTVYSDTAPHAICLAALKSMDIKL